jgi:hypothetical protein
MIIAISCTIQPAAPTYPPTNQPPQTEPEQGGTTVTSDDPTRLHSSKDVNCLTMY